MLSLKVLKGLAGDLILELKPGENIIGRAPDCHVVIRANGVSKRHAKITVHDDKCIITDLNSSNGTFVNGAKITDRILNIGDRIAFHDVIVELGFAQMAPSLPRGFTQSQIPQVPATQSGNLAYQINPLPGINNGAVAQGQSHLPAPQHQPTTLVEHAKAYTDNVILPGLYQINEIYPTRTILGGFVLVFILLVTFLASIPMAQMTKAGIQKEAQRRALTIAKQLADISSRAINAGAESNINTSFSEAEEGVTLAIVVSREDGHIIAPLTKGQSYTNDEFVVRARKHDDTFTQQINDTLIGASVPIQTFNKETGTP